MSNLLAHFEPSELVDFMNFIGLLIHKLNVGFVQLIVTLELTWLILYRKTCLMYSTN